jgi:protocatechuate 3,4-dioxygenase beta subunit
MVPWALGCSGNPSASSGLTDAASSGSGDADILPDRQSVDGAAADLTAGDGAPSADTALPPTCGQTTAANIEGPFFKPSSPLRTNLRQAGLGGTLLHISGRVLGTNCAPLSGALLDFWQANSAGAYDQSGNVLRGHQLTDNQGRYTLETIVPGRYLNGPTYRPAHVHVKVAAAGFQGLTTQLYFPGDPFNAGDPFILPSLIMNVTSTMGRSEATFDFVLAL